MPNFFTKRTISIYQYGSSYFGGYKNRQEVINVLEVENKGLKVQVKSLSKRQGDLEQYSGRNTLEIFVEPDSPTETDASLKRTVIDIGAALGVTIKEDGIEACH
ncbi:hypothetical protein J6590_041942 [Homalodisca vitripennis]|nr:hypothetical protein J6590_041942 [Homalodisca vitripennis]